MGLVDFEYAKATGLKKFLSKDSLNSKVILLNSSKGSLISSASIKEILRKVINIMRSMC
jgi:predicted aconitase with swiveling domain